MNDIIAIREIGVGLAAFMVFVWALIRVMREVKVKSEPVHSAHAAVPSANGKAGEISVAAWELKFKSMFEECLDRIATKMDVQHAEKMRALDRIENRIERLID